VFGSGGKFTVSAPEFCVNVKPTILCSISKACVVEPGFTRTTELTSPGELGVCTMKLPVSPISAPGLCGRGCLRAPTGGVGVVSKGRADRLTPPIRPGRESVDKPNSLNLKRTKQCDVPLPCSPYRALWLSANFP